MKGTPGNTVILHWDECRMLWAKLSWRDWVRFRGYGAGRQSLLAGARAGEHYEWSFQSAHLPHPEYGQPVFAGLAADPHAGQQWRDLFTRLRRPSEVFTAERLSRWAAAWQDRPRIGESTAHG